MFLISYSNQFKKDVKLLLKRGNDLDLLKISIIELENNGTLPSSQKPHKLIGNYEGYWEGHIKPDWLLIWKTSGNEVTLVRTGTHSDLF